MTADTDQPTLAVTQADRSAYQELRGLWGPKLQAMLDGGEFDASWDMQLLARHLTTHEPHPAGDLREALEKVQNFLREPDHAEHFGTDQLVEWINRRPTHIIPKLLATHSPTPMAGEVAIWSGEHRAYWRRGADGSGAGYTISTEHAGVWQRAEAVRLTGGCGPEKLIALHDRPAAHPSTQEGGTE